MLILGLWDWPQLVGFFFWGGGFGYYHLGFSPPLPPLSIIKLHKNPKISKLLFWGFGIWQFFLWDCGIYPLCIAKFLNGYHIK